ncbi:urokinase plasminogen activator surface receptor-like isoform X2 [Hemicordylus capensis]|uniref:urokinase plasminogen activator surface receptor-like isoform X2 n=1 Tax=Hemicordylus capensis TaxID=884348 RepID=UPI0023028CC9|nr:urokinase plasminogen activator surface receptor-like isoform X2 [Hemicordylus capensis]
MKVGVSLAVLLSWLAIANSLRCQKCLSRQGSCTETMMEVCKPQQDACFIEIKWYLGLRADTVKQGCGTTNLCRRYPGGYRGSLYRTMYCCAIDLCRPVEHHVDRNGTKNGLQCHTCIGSIDECGQNTPSESCYGSEERCVQISQRFLPAEELEPVIKGCGNDSFKDTLVAYQIGNDFAYVDQKVCTGSNCNNRSFPEIPAGKPNGLQCYTCRDSGHGECAQDKLQILPCTGILDHCVHVIDRDNRSVTLQKGCATESMCSASQDIYYKLMRQDSFVECCKSSLCNQVGASSGSRLENRLVVMVMVMALVLLLAPRA